MRSGEDKIGNGQSLCYARMDKLNYDKCVFQIKMMNFVLKNKELCIKNKQLCIKNKEFCIYNDEFCSYYYYDGEVDVDTDDSDYSTDRCAILC